MTRRSTTGVSVGQRKTVLSKSADTAPSQGSMYVVLPNEGRYDVALSEP